MTETAKVTERPGIAPMMMPAKIPTFIISRFSTVMI